MNNVINEIKNTLEGTNSRIMEAEDRISEVEDKTVEINEAESERLLLNDKTLGFLASRGDEFNPGPEMRLDRSELLCDKVLLKYKGDRESF